MIHNPWTFADGDADQLQKQADMLEQVKLSIIAAYKEKTTLNQSQLEDMMNNETWMTAKEALKQGFCDEVVKIKNFAKQYVAVYAMLSDDKPNNLKDKKMIKMLLAFFGLTESATDEQISTALVNFRKDFGLPENAGIKELAAKFAELDNEPEPEPDSVQNALLQELLEERAENLISNAVTDFKILAVDSDIWKERAKLDYKGTKALLDKRAKNSVKPGKVTVQKHQPDTNKKESVTESAANFMKEVGRVPVKEAKV
jgi:hypothetical protein